MKQSKAIYAKDILSILDKEALEYNFPMPDNLCNYNAGMRLTAFRSMQEWLIIFEMLNYTQNHEFLNEICAFGNKLEVQGFAFESPVLIETIKNTSFYKENGNFCIEPSQCSVQFKKESVSVCFHDEDYQKARVDQNSKAPTPAKLLRLFASAFNKNIYEENENLLKLVGRSNSGLMQFIKLEEWQHPDLAQDELPSQSISMLSLSEALEEGKPEIYFCPKEKINSHWYYWGEEHNGWS